MALEPGSSLDQYPVTALIGEGGYGPGYIVPPTRNGAAMSR